MKSKVTEETLRSRDVLVDLLEANPEGLGIYDIFAHLNSKKLGLKHRDREPVRQREFVNRVIRFAKIHGTNIQYRSDDQKYYLSRRKSGMRTNQYGMPVAY